MLNPSFLSKNYSYRLIISKSVKKKKSKTKKLHILNFTYSVMYFPFIL